MISCLSHRLFIKNKIPRKSVASLNKPMNGRAPYQISGRACIRRNSLSMASEWNAIRDTLKAAILFTCSFDCGLLPSEQKKLEHHFTADLNIPSNHYSTPSLSVYLFSLKKKFSRCLVELCSFEIISEIIRKRKIPLDDLNYHKIQIDTSLL